MSGDSSSTKDTSSSTNYDTSSLESMLTGTTGSNSTTGWADAMSSISKLMPGLTTAATSSTTQTPAQTSAYDTLLKNAQNSTNNYDFNTYQTQKLASDLLSGSSHGAGKLINSGFNNYSTSTGQNSSALDSAFNNYSNSTDSNSALLDRAYYGLMGSSAGNVGMLKNAYGDIKQTLNPYTREAYLDPTKTPGIQNVIQTIQHDIGNSVNSQFAGAGRDMSGMNLQALGRGVSQGMAVPLLDQYNKNVQAQMNAANSLYGAGSNTASSLQSIYDTLYGAGNTTALNKQGLGSSKFAAAGATAAGKQNLAESLYNASNTTASGLNSLLQQDYSRRAAGLSLGADAVPAAQNAQANAILDAANTQQSAAASQYAPYLSLLSSLAGLGQTTDSSSTSAASGTTTGTGTSNSTGTENRTSTMSPFMQAMMALSVGSSAYKNFGFGS